jgi:hypothetical protein
LRDTSYRVHDNRLVRSSFPIAIDATAVSNMNIPYTLIHKRDYVKVHSENTYLKQVMEKAMATIDRIEHDNFEQEASDTDHEILRRLNRLKIARAHAVRQEQEQQWIAQGLARFMEILRNHNHDLALLTSHLISSLVKYTGANQGALFIVNGQDSNDCYLDMLACYAYGRKKYLEKRVKAGEGILGQAYREKQTIYMTQVPNGYTTITSGLGETTPGSILVVPLKIDEQVLAVVELASFKHFQSHEIQFIEKLGENIAATLSGVRTHARTIKLLAESQQQSEELLAQEEEMRQNMEELQATQEAQARLETELRLRLEELEHAKNQIELMRKSELEKMKKQNEVQAGIMSATLEKFRKREAELLAKLEHYQLLEQPGKASHN